LRAEPNSTNINGDAMYGFLADALVATHVAYAAFIVIGQLLIILGSLFQWRWARNPWFRGLHLAAIGIVVFEEIIGLRCPLTVWEEQLRVLAGQTDMTSETFMGRMMRSILFGTWPSSVYTTIHIAFGVIVLQGFIMYPPSRSRKLEGGSGKESTVLAGA
jgi:Protein of Unknown function (DUF2784)